MQQHSSAVVATDKAARYARQLVSHLGRRNGGEWSETDGRGWIDLGDGRTEVSTETGDLALSVSTDDGDLDRLEDVVGRHLVRFGARDELRVQWSRADGSPGTTQEAPSS